MGIITYISRLIVSICACVFSEISKTLEMSIFDKKYTPRTAHRPGNVIYVMIFANNFMLKCAFYANSEPKLVVIVGFFGYIHENRKINPNVNGFNFVENSFGNWMSAKNSFIV